MTDTESAIRKKLSNLLTELRGFKFVTTLAIEFKKIESDDPTKYINFNSKLLNLTQKQKRFLMMVILMAYLNQSIPRSYQTYKKILEEIRAGLLIQ